MQCSCLNCPQIHMNWLVSSLVQRGTVSIRNRSSCQLYSIQRVKCKKSLCAVLTLIHTLGQYHQFSSVSYNSQCALVSDSTLLIQSLCCCVNSNASLSEVLSEGNSKYVNLSPGISPYKTSGNNNCKIKILPVGCDVWSVGASVGGTVSELPMSLSRKCSIV